MKALLFDMDGVLVDVTGSYRRAIRESVRKISGREVSCEKIQEYKAMGGWNDDWALTRKILRDFGVDVPLKRVVEVFQEIYRGKGFRGLIRRDRWMLETRTAAALGERFELGIVTGRSRDEALYTLSRFPGRALFKVCVTRNDVPPGKGKPDPWGLISALSRLGGSSGWYAGDSVDDMKAAAGAGLIPVGVIPPGGEESFMRKKLNRSGARAVIGNVNDLEEVLP